MQCPFCKAKDTEVYNSRPSGKFRVWRRRRCPICNKSFTTYEAIDLGFLQVQRSKGAPEPYQRYKLFNSLYTACRALRSRSEAVEALTATVEDKLLGSAQTTITTAEIKETVLETLKAFNLNAYLRYLTDQTELMGLGDLRAKLKD